MVALLLLMLLAEQVVDRFDGIEGRDRHFDEDGVPAAHSAVPETRQLECEQFLTVFRLIGDKAGLRVDILRQIEGFAFVVAYRTNEIYGVEVG